MNLSIVLAYNNFAESLVLPILPMELMIPMNTRMNEEYEIFSGVNGVGKLNLSGLRDLKVVTLSSFFPVHDYTFARSKEKGWSCVNKINRWTNTRNPIRIIITADNIEMLNMACLVESFEYGLDRSGDIPYTLTLKEFVFVR